VIAGKLAGAGLKLVVLEAGGYFDESDFNQLELWAYQNIYWRGGPTLTADMNINIQAGATLGGGSTVNWTNCLRTRPWVREEWAREHGLEGVDGPDYDRHLDAVSQRYWRQRQLLRTQRTEPAPQGWSRQARMGVQSPFAQR
jgi:Choline dehydrogenase and related flavoproteins